MVCPARRKDAGPGWARAYEPPSLLGNETVRTGSFAGHGGAPPIEKGMKEKKEELSVSPAVEGGVRTNFGSLAALSLDEGCKPFDEGANAILRRRVGYTAVVVEHVAGASDRQAALEPRSGAECAQYRQPRRLR